MLFCGLGFESANKPISDILYRNLNSEHQTKIAYFLRSNTPAKQCYSIFGVQCTTAVVLDTESQVRF